MAETRIVFDHERLDSDFKIATNDRPLGHFKLDALDSLLGGVKPRFHIIAGEPATGKSTLLLQMADDLASQGHTVLFFTLEMHPSQLLKKSLSRLSVDPSCAPEDKLDLASISDAELLSCRQRTVLDALRAEYARSISPRITFIDKGSTPRDISVLISRCQRELGVTPVVFIDYLQILQLDIDESAPVYTQQVEETQSVRAVTKSLRNVIDRHRMPAYAISSINRVNYGKEVSSLGALPSSSALEYEADNVVFMMVEGKTPKERIENMGQPVRPVKLSVLKHRYAPPGNAVILFDSEHTSFEERE